MIGICPNCKINLKDPPFSNRERNEILIVMIYRRKIDNNEAIRSMDEIGYCEICGAKKEELEDQKDNNK